MRGTDDTIRELERELRHSPGDARSRLSLARVLARARRTDDAASHVERVLRDDPLSRAGLEALDELGFPPLSRESPWPTVNGGNDRARRSSQPGARKGVLARRVRIGALAGRLGDGSVERARSLTVGGDGCAYIATDKQRLIALDLNAEEPRWIRDDIEHPFAAPTVGAGERLALACQDTVRLIDGKTGETIWIARSPGVTSDDVPANATFAPRGLVLAPGIRGALYALDAVTGKMRWSVGTRGAQLTAPLVIGEVIFVRCAFGTLSRLDLEGRPGNSDAPPSETAIEMKLERNPGASFVKDSAGCTYAVMPGEFMLMWMDPTGTRVKELTCMNTGVIVIGPDSTVLVPSPEGFLQIIE